MQARLKTPQPVNWGQHQHLVAMLVIKSGERRESRITKHLAAAPKVMSAFKADKDLPTSVQSAPASCFNYGSIARGRQAAIGTER